MSDKRLRELEKCPPTARAAHEISRDRLFPSGVSLRPPGRSELRSIGRPYVTDRIANHVLDGAKGVLDGAKGVLVYDFSRIRRLALELPSVLWCRSPLCCGN